MGGLNGHQHVSLPLPDATRAKLLARIEAALARMATALIASGFSEFEVSTVNLATRFAITSVVKERGRGS